MCQGLADHHDDGRARDDKKNEAGCREGEKKARVNDH